MYDPYTAGVRGPEDVTLSIRLHARWLALLLLVLSGCEPESTEDACRRAADEFCANRGGCAELLHTLEVRRCVRRSS